METTLSALRDGQEGNITVLHMEGALRRRLLDFGLIEGTRICCLRKSPLGSPVLCRVRGTMLALRLCDCKKISVAVETCV